MKSWGGPYPDHCMAGTPGQQKIDETKPLNPLTLENREYTPDEIKQILDHDGEIVFRRQQFEKAGRQRAPERHPAARPAAYQDIVMYGVYTEACVAREIAALIGVGPKLHIITDAVAIVGTESSTFHENCCSKASSCSPSPS